MSINPQSTTFSPPAVRVGIIGGGFGALMVYGVLRFRGVRREDILIFSPDSSPEQSWERHIRAIKLHSLRSESTGHFYPTESPGLATVDALSQWSLRPLIQSWFDRYHPRVDTFIRHVKKTAWQTGYYRSLVPTMVGRIERLEGWFGIYDTQNNFLAFAQHVIMAVGHGKQRLPETVAKFRENYPGDSRVVLAYENKAYAPPRKVLVVGDGLTAATEWANILEAGGSVVGLSLQGFSFGQALNCPRGYLFRYRLKPYAGQSDRDRLAEIKSATRGTIPNYPRWKTLFRKAQGNGRLQLIQATLKEIHVTAENTLEAIIDLPEDRGQQTIPVDQVCSATGFLAPLTHPLLAQLINDYQLETMDGIPMVDDECCLQKISTHESCITLMGAAAAWALPCADQLGGLKLAAHRIANKIIGPERWSFKPITFQTMRWLQLLVGKELT